MSLAEWVVPIVVVLVSVGGSVLVGLRSTREQTSASKETTAAAVWGPFAQSLQEERDQDRLRIEALEGQRKEDRASIAKLDAKVTKVERALRSLHDRYGIAVRHIKAVELLHAAAVRAGVLLVMPPIPDLIRSDVDDPPDTELPPID